MKNAILSHDRKYTFSDYFNLNHLTEEIIAELGYSFSQKAIRLPRSENYDAEAIRNLKDTFYTILPKITTNSEIARKEFLIAPILMEIAKTMDVSIKVEYPVEVSDRLSGSLDYLLRARREIIVIEAKKADMDRGFTQLAAELIALDEYEEGNVGDVLYGAVTIGNVWNFGTLERDKKHIVKDIDGYTIPGDLDRIFSILIGILTG